MSCKKLVPLDESKWLEWSRRLDERMRVRVKSISVGCCMTGWPLRTGTAQATEAWLSWRRAGSSRGWGACWGCLGRASAPPPGSVSGWGAGGGGRGGEGRGGDCPAQAASRPERWDWSDDCRRCNCPAPPSTLTAGTPTGRPGPSGCP